MCHVYWVARNSTQNVTGCLKYRMYHVYWVTRNDTRNVTGCLKYQWLREDKMVAQNGT